MLLISVAREADAQKKDLSPLGWIVEYGKQLHIDLPVAVWSTLWDVAKGFAGVGPAKIETPYDK